MIKIKNWKEFQHFKERTPPWIKLHKKILEQRDIMMISDCSFRILVGLWLLASEDKDLNGKLPSIDDIAFRLRKTNKEIKIALEELSSFLEDDDINMISEGYQDDDPETEEEVYSKEEEVKKNIEQFENFWEVYGYKIGKDKAVIAYKKLIKSGVTHDEIISGVRNYQRNCQARGISGRYIKHPTTWLNGGHWKDEYPEFEPQRPTASKAQRAREAAIRGLMS